MKEQSFSCRMKYFLYHMDKKRTNASVLKDLSENQIFSPLRIKAKTIEKQYPFGTQDTQYTSINNASNGLKPIQTGLRTLLFLSLLT